MSARPLNDEVIGLPFGDCASSSPTRSLDAMTNAEAPVYFRKSRRLGLIAAPGLGHEGTKARSVLVQSVLRVFVSSWQIHLRDLDSRGDGRHIKVLDPNRRHQRRPRTVVRLAGVDR